MQSNFASMMNQFVRRLISLDRNQIFCYGVTLSQYYVIDTLHKRNMMTMNELSQELGLAISTLTRIINILVRDDIVSRYHSEEDRRKVCIGLTEKGTELAQKLQACSEQFWNKIFDNIPPNKKNEIIENLSTLQTIIEGMKNECCRMM